MKKITFNTEIEKEDCFPAKFADDTDWKKIAVTKSSTCKLQ
jgi:hypothetical protein